MVESTSRSVLFGNEHELFGLSVDYAVAADTLDADLFVHGFLPDGVLEVRDVHGHVPRQMRGHDAIAGVMEKLAPFRYTFHILGQARYSYTEDDDTATGVVYCVAHHVDEVASPTDLVMHIRYLDKYVRDAARAWKFRHRTVEVGFLTRPEVTAVLSANTQRVP
jgi:hypothetical protein